MGTGDSNNLLQFIHDFNISSRDFMTDKMATVDYRIQTARYGYRCITYSVL